MKKLILILLSSITLSCQPQKTDKPFTKQALDAPVITMSGKTIRFGDLLKSYTGKTIVIDVWASWCADCIKGLPKLKKLQKKHPEASYVFISLDRNPQDWKNGIKRFSIKGAHYYVEGGWKSIFAKHVDLDWIPRYILIDSTNKVVVYRAIHADDKHIREYFKNKNQ